MFLRGLVHPNVLTHDTVFSVLKHFTPFWTRDAPLLSALWSFFFFPCLLVLARLSASKPKGYFSSLELLSVKLAAFLDDVQRTGANSELRPTASSVSSIAHQYLDVKLCEAKD